MKRAMYDLEVYPNLMLFGIRLANGKIKQYSAFGSDDSLCEKDVKKIRKLITKHQLVGFNSMNYDDPVLTYMLSGEPCDEIYHLSKAIVEEGLQRWDVYRKIGLKNEVNSIDIMEVAPQRASLKLYGTRVFTKKTQDLPYDPHKKLSKKQAKEVADYNINDLQLTLDVYSELIPQLHIREDIGAEYGINVMSRSDAQVAEDVFKKVLGLAKKPKIDRPSEVRYKAPKYVKFKSKHLKKLKKKFEKSVYEINQATGKFVAQEWLKEKVVIAGIEYTVGIGGLHSNEKSMVVEGDIKNADIASMYPSLIINSGKYPTQLGQEWLDLYEKFRDDRMLIKHTDKKLSAMLKIFLNGSYGKLNSVYSILYAPHLMLDTTITGQLSLLMVIEALTDAGIRVISANTDGVEYVDNTTKGEKIIDELGEKMNLVWEHASYKALYARDVNNYVAVYDGYVKSKGAYGEPTLSKNSEYPIVFKAIREYLLSGIPFDVTLKDCTEIAQFCSSRSVTGGGLWSNEKFQNTKEYDDYIRMGKKQNKALEKRNMNFQKDLVLASDNAQYLGKVVRFYYGANGSPIYYKKSGNQVPKSEGSVPMMELSKKIPKNLDYNKYLELCQKHLKELGS